MVGASDSKWDYRHPAIPVSIRTEGKRGGKPRPGGMGPWSNLEHSGVREASHVPAQAETVAQRVDGGASSPASGPLRPNLAAFASPHHRALMPSIFSERDASALSSLGGSPPPLLPASPPVACPSCGYLMHAPPLRMLLPCKHAPLCDSCSPRAVGRRCPTCECEILCVAANSIVIAGEPDPPASPASAVEGGTAFPSASPSSASWGREDDPFTGPPTAGSAGPPCLPCGSAVGVGAGAGSDESLDLCPPAEMDDAAWLRRVDASATSAGELTAGGRPTKLAKSPLKRLRRSNGDRSGISSDHESAAARGGKRSKGNPGTPIRPVPCEAALPGPGATERPSGEAPSTPILSPFKPYRVAADPGLSGGEDVFPSPPGFPSGAPDTPSRPFVASLSESLSREKPRRRPSNRFHPLAPSSSSPTLSSRGRRALQAVAAFSHGSSGAGQQ